MQYLVYLFIYAGLAIALLFVFSLIWAGVTVIQQRRKLDSAWREYREIQEKYGDSAKDHCPHRLFEIGQVEAGVITLSTKWCRTCKKDLGPAKLTKSLIFGNKWD